MAYYRVVRDAYSGFEVQAFRWWFPFWIQVGLCNTHPTIERAEKFAENSARAVVKYLGKFPTKENKA